MKALELVQRDVLDEMVWDPHVDSATIAVTVPQQGVVRLSGAVGSFAEKLAAELAARRVVGVRAVVDDLDVKLAATMTADEKIAKAAIDAMRLRTAVPRDSVTVTVEDGYLTLSGRVSWLYQRRAAANAVRFLPGVKGVMNLLEVEAKPSRMEPQRALSLNSR